MNHSRMAIALAGAIFFILLHPVWADNQLANRPIADKWALVIGVSQFADSSLNLKYSAKDAEDFYNYLITDGHFSKDHVKLLLNEQATRQNILANIGDTWLPKVANPDDLVILFISSHGSPADTNIGNVNYILTHDTNQANISATAIAMQDLSQVLKTRMRSDRLVLILDACHSGAGGAGTESKGIIRSTSINADEIAQQSGRTVISSSEPNQMSWESKDYPNGVFTHYLIEGLHQKENHATLGEAFNYMKDKVQEEVLRDQGALQTPALKGTTDSTMIVVSAAPIRPGAAPSSAGNQTQSAGTTGSPNEGVEIALASPLATQMAQTRIWQTYLDGAIKASKEGRYGEAEKMLTASLKEAEKFGLDSPRYAESLSEFAKLLYIRGQYEEAESYCRKALSIREKALGAEDPAVAQSLNILALIMQARGKYSVAETLFNQSLDIWKKNPGPDSIEVALSLNNAAENLLERGKYTEASVLCHQSLEMRERLLPDSPAVAESLATLGKLDYKVGKYSDAKKVLQRALEVDERTLGSEHPALINCLNSLGQLYIVQHRYADAEPLFYRSLAIAESSLGPDHPAVADSLLKLALIYELHGKYPQAETNYKRALEIREKAFGSSTPPVAESLTNLAWLNYAQEQYPQADSLYRRAQSICEKSLEQDDPNVATTLEYYTHLLRATSRRKQATAIQAKIKAMRAKHTMQNPNTSLKADSAILSARAAALTEKQKEDRKRK